MHALAYRLPTADDLLGLDPSRSWEILSGEIVERAMPAGKHGLAQAYSSAELIPTYGRRRGPDGRGGWWILTEPTVQLDLENVVQPDVAGWRRDRVPTAPTGYPVLERPDWVCEILSPATRARDLSDKRRLYHRAAVPHYWILDPDLRFLTVLRWTEAGYLIALTATAEERVHAEPFDALEIRVGALLGEDEPEPAPGG